MFHLPTHEDNIGCIGVVALRVMKKFRFKALKALLLAGWMVARGVGRRPTQHTVCYTTTTTGRTQHTTFLTHPVLLVDPCRRVPPVCDEGMTALSNDLSVEEGGQLRVAWRQIVNGEVAADEAILQIDELAQ